MVRATDSFNPGKNVLELGSQPWYLKAAQKFTELSSLRVKPGPLQQGELGNRGCIPRPSTQKAEADGQRSRLALATKTLSQNLKKHSSHVYVLTLPGIFEIGMCIMSVVTMTNYQTKPT